MAKKLNTPVWNSERMAHEIKEHLIDSGKRGSLPSKKFLNKAKEYWSEKEIRKFLGVHEEYPLDIA
jgi:hypothetical protein